jgi:hypothetical protein
LLAEYVSTCCLVDVTRQLGTKDTEIIDFLFSSSCDY